LIHFYKRYEVSTMASAVHVGNEEYADMQ